MRALTLFLSCVAAALGHGDHAHGDHDHGDHADHVHGDHADHVRGDHGDHADRGSRHGHALEASPYAGCDEVVVGGGWAGVYFAWRRATGGAANASAVCLFERSARVGGRTYSVELNGTDALAEFTLDVGAYRFSPDMHLPGDLILHHLALPTECYEPSCSPAYEDWLFQFNYTAPLRRVVDATTRLPAGYVTAIDAMVDEMVAGARAFRETALVAIAAGGAAHAARRRRPPRARARARDRARTSCSTPRS